MENENKFDKISYNNKWIAEKCDRINLVVPKGQKSIIEDIAKSQGESINGYIKKALQDKIKADTGQDLE